MKTAFRVGRMIVAVAACAVLCSCGSKCDDYTTQMQICLDSHCGLPGSSAFVCNCWSQGMDADPDSCTCIPLVWDDVCNELEAQGLQPDDVVAACGVYVQTKTGNCL